MGKAALRGMLALVLLAAAAGCGNGGEVGLPEYRERISELHDGVAWDLGAVLEQLNGLSFADYYDLPELREIFAAAEKVFSSARDTAGSLSPPQQALSLHPDLLDFYAAGAESMRGLRDSLGFFEAVFPMLSDVENLALPNLAAGAGAPEIKAAAMEDGKTMGGYIAELEGMKPPDELGPYRDELVHLLRSIDEAAAALDRAVTAEDIDPFALYLQWFEGAREGSQELWEEAMAYLGGLGAVLDGYIEQGGLLAARMHQL